MSHILRRAALISALRRTPPRRPIRVEPLEPRETPAAVGGLAFFDYDGDGTRDPGEAAVTSPVLTVQLDVGADGSIDATTTTDNLGRYTFAGVADGTHKVVLTVPAGFTGTSANPLTVTVAGGADATGQDFALRPTGAITGVVFEDRDANGIRDASEAAVVPNVTVTGDAFADGTIDFTATTDADGRYTFTGVPNGPTKVTVTAPPGYEALFGGSVTVAVAGGAVTARDVGLGRPAVITGLVFADYNQNGTQDATEPGAAKVTVVLDKGADGFIDAATTTTADGTFGFTGVVDGVYLVRYYSSPIPLEGVQTTDPPLVTVDQGKGATGLRIGLLPYGIVSGRVFEDANANGVQDPGEPGIAGAPVSLDVGADGTTEVTRFADEAGNYRVFGAPPGTHRVIATAPGFVSDGVLVTFPPGGGDVPNINLGLGRPAVVTGRVFQDIDGDGTRDASEPGLAGVTVGLDRGNDESVDATTTTRFDGTYGFTAVPDGTHELVVTVPPGFTAVSATDRTFTVGPAGAEVRDIDFALRGGSITGVVFEDRDGNGLFTPVTCAGLGCPAPEAGLAGLTVALDLLDDGTVDLTATTAADGSYSFANVPDGTHELSVAAPGFTRTTVNPLTVTFFQGRYIPPPLPAAPAFPPVAGQSPFPRLPGNPFDFGFLRSAVVTAGAFDDQNGDGTQGGEPVLTGVSIGLDLGADGTIDTTLVTGPGGNVYFPGVPDGRHAVVVTVPPGREAVGATVRTFDVAGGKEASGLAFALRGGSTAAGLAFADYDGDGMRDPGEPGQPDVVVAIDLGDDGSFDAVTTTDPSGKFSVFFTPPGPGVVRVIAPGGFTLTSPVKVSLGAGDAVFALRPNGSLGGLVFDDANANGRRDPGEAGVAGAGVEVDAGGDGTIDFTAMTDATGAYRVTGLRGGVALVRVAAPTGFAAGPLTPPVLGGFTTAGFAVGGLDFGLARVTPAVVRGVVFLDLDGDGTRDVGEPAVGGLGLINVTINGPVSFGGQTDDTGTFTFTGVPDGEYRLTTPGLIGFTPTTPPRVFTVGGGDVGGLAVGIRRNRSGGGVVTGTVFRDENGNGVRDPGDGPVAGATVQASSGAADSGNKLFLTVTTDAEGRYTLAGLEGVPQFIRATGLGGVTTEVAAGVIGDGTTLDLGLRPTRSLAVTVFVDLNGNGVRDPNEAPAAGVPVRLERTGSPPGVDRPPLDTRTTDAAGVATFTDMTDGNYVVQVQLPGAAITTLPAAVNVLNGAVFPGQIAVGYRLRPAAASTIAVGTDARTINSAQVFNGDGRPSGGPAVLTLPTPTGVRVATGDVNGDGVADYAVGSGPGAEPTVRVFDGKTGAVLFGVIPFELTFTGGVFVALGDLTGDGRADLVITPDEGGGPRVRVFDAGNGFAPLADFFGIADANFRGGARAAVGHVNADGVGDLVVAAGFGGGPRIAVFDGTTVRPDKTPQTLFNDFFVFEQTLRNGVYVTVGDVDGDGFGDVIAGGGPGGGPRVFAVSGKDLISSGGATLTPLANFFAGGADADRTGVKPAVKDLDGDAKADVVAGYKPTVTAVPRLAAYLGKDLSATGGTPQPYFDIEPYPGFTGGIFVG